MSFYTWKPKLVFLDTAKTQKIKHFSLSYPTRKLENKQKFPLVSSYGIRVENETN